MALPTPGEFVVQPQVDRGLHVAAQVTFDFTLAVNNLADLVDIFIGNIIGPDIKINVRLL